MYTLYYLENECVCTWEYVSVGTCVFMWLWGCPDTCDMHKCMSVCMQKCEGMSVNTCMSEGVLLPVYVCEKVSVWVCEYVCICVFDEH